MTQAEKAQGMINRRRNAAGLPSLRRRGAEELTAYAREWAQWMAEGHDDERFDHSDAVDRFLGHGWNGIGECIHYATWTATSHVDAVKGWFDSPPHKKILMTSKATHIGLGRFYDEAENTVFWVAIVGRKSA